jgi:hypothetical protein
MEEQGKNASIVKITLLICLLQKDQLSIVTIAKYD